MIYVATHCSNRENSTKTKLQVSPQLARRNGKEQDFRRGLKVRQGIHVTNSVSSDTDNKNVTYLSSDSW